MYVIKECHTRARDLDDTLDQRQKLWRLKQETAESWISTVHRTYIPVSTDSAAHVLVNPSSTDNKVVEVLEACPWKSETLKRWTSSVDSAVNLLSADDNFVSVAWQPSKEEAKPVESLTSDDDQDLGPSSAENSFVEVSDPLHSGHEKVEQMESLISAVDNAVNPSSVDDRFVSIESWHPSQEKTEPVESLISTADYAHIPLSPDSASDVPVSPSSDNKVVKVSEASHHGQEDTEPMESWTSDEDYALRPLSTDSTADVPVDPVYAENNFVEILESQRQLQTKPVESWTSSVDHISVPSFTNDNLVEISVFIFNFGFQFKTLLKEMVLKNCY